MRNSLFRLGMENLFVSGGFPTRESLLVILFRLSMENLFVSGGSPTRESLLVIFVVKVRSYASTCVYVCVSDCVEVVTVTKLVV